MAPRHPLQHGQFHQIVAALASGLVVPADFAAGSAEAIWLTRHTLNHHYRSPGPAFDASFFAEFYGFGGPDAREGLASHQEKRPPRFDP